MLRTCAHTWTHLRSLGGATEETTHNPREHSRRLHMLRTFPAGRRGERWPPLPRGCDVLDFTSLFTSPAHVRRRDPHTGTPVGRATEHRNEGTGEVPPTRRSPVSCRTRPPTAGARLRPSAPPARRTEELARSQASWLLTMRQTLRQTSARPCRVCGLAGEGRRKREPRLNSFPNSEGVWASSGVTDTRPRRCPGRRRDSAV